LVVCDEFAALQQIEKRLTVCFGHASADPRRLRSVPVSGRLARIYHRGIPAVKQFQLYFNQVF
jgi:hypothetical protein